jgi:hypothetical protein
MADDQAPRPGLEQAGAILQSGRLKAKPSRAPAVSKRMRRKLDAIELVRDKRDAGNQEIAYSSRPFILCGIPIHQPKGKDNLLYVRRNGRFSLKILANPEYGLPYGQDRLVLIWIASLAIKQQSKTVRFKSIHEVIRTFDLNRNGRVYRRIFDGIQRIFASSVFFGIDDDQSKHSVFDWTRFHYFDRVRLRNDYLLPEEQELLPSEDFHNVIELNEFFFEELIKHPIPIDLETVRALADSPGALDLCMWIYYRSWSANEEQRVNLFGQNALEQQLGCGATAKRTFRRQINRWLKVIRAAWPECPAHLLDDEDVLVIQKGKAITTQTVRGLLEQG